MRIPFDVPYSYYRDLKIPEEFLSGFHSRTLLKSILDYSWSDTTNGESFTTLKNEGKALTYYDSMEVYGDGELLWSSITGYYKYSRPRIYAIIDFTLGVGFNYRAVGYVNRITGYHDNNDKVEVDTVISSTNCGIFYSAEDLGNQNIDINAWGSYGTWDGEDYSYEFASLEFNLNVLNSYSIKLTDAFVINRDTSQSLGIDEVTITNDTIESMSIMASGNVFTLDETMVFGFYAIGIDTVPNIEDTSILPPGTPYPPCDEIIYKVNPNGILYTEEDLDLSNLYQSKYLLKLSKENSPDRYRFVENASIYKNTPVVENNCVQYAIATKTYTWQGTAYTSNVNKTHEQRCGYYAEQNNPLGKFDVRFINDKNYRNHLGNFHGTRI